MDRQKLQMATLFCAVLVAFTLLPAGISKLKIRQDKLPIAFSFVPVVKTAKRATKPKKVSSLITIIAVTAIIVGFLFFLITGGFKQLIGFAIIVGLFLLARFLIQNTSRPANVAEPQMQSLDIGDKLPPIPKPPIAEPESWVTWVFAVSICAVLLIGGLILWRWAKKRLSPAEQVAVEAKKTIEQIKGGEDLKEVIIRCYYDMTTILGKHHQLKRAASMTPREFEAFLQQAGFLTEDVSQLSRLFERARYGRQNLGKSIENEAINCLDTFARFCEKKDV